MPIKYAEITVIINLKEESMIKYLNRLMGLENSVDDADTIIIVFDTDEFIYEITNENTNKSIRWGPVYSNIPTTYFDIRNNIFIKNQILHDVNGCKRLNYNAIFGNSKKYLTMQKIASIYNVIYHTIEKEEVLYMVKIQSSSEKPRFLLAYEDSYFEHNDINYFVNCILKNKFVSC